MNLPKFTINDIPLFNSITSDLFPGVVLEERSYGELMNAMSEACEELKLIAKPEFLNKCI